MFDRAAGLPPRVTPAAPILFFGDLDAYRASPLRVLTVGLNPSWHEFPAGNPFQRFPLLNGGSTDREPSRYLDAMSAYFHAHPYRKWFRAFERVLDGAGTSYYTGKAAVALHTDICSPVATNPTWSRLGDTDRAGLEADGGPLWHTLLETLRPHMVALSVASAHLRRIEFAPVDQWRTIHEFERTRDGAPRSRPYEVRGRWYEAGGECSLFICTMIRCPPKRGNSTLSDNQKHELGAISLETYRDGR